MDIAVTGAGGFLGRGMVETLAVGHRLRLLDVAPFPSPHEVRRCDVADPAQVEAALTGVQSLVIAHMAPRGAENVNYRTPAVPFAINVAGTANLFDAAVRLGIRRVVLISSTAAVDDRQDLARPPQQLALRGKEVYGLSKACQEFIAEHYARTAGLQVACLRIGYVLDGDANRDKYGKPVGERNWADTDRRDVGEVARLCLERDDLGFSVFNVMSAPEAMEAAALGVTCERLGWRPRHDFSWLRAPGTAGAP
jgi:nucleoside-diphosphate-sugar epimerase